MALPNIIQQINSKLPLSGGDMTGNINWNRGVIRQNGHSFEFVGDKDLPNQTSFIACRSVLHSNESGWFYFGARNKEGGYMGICKPDGTFTWGGNNVITSKGGYINGNLYVKGNNYAGLQASSTSVTWGVGSAWNDAPCISLYSPAYADLPGVFAVRAISSDGTRKELVGTPTGTLTWNGKSVVCVTYYRSGASWYRKYSDGFIEQGGNVTPSAAWTKISLITAFSNTNYQIIVSTTDPDTNGSINGVAWRDKTTSSFSSCSAYNGPFYSSVLNWYACGY